MIFGYQQFSFDNNSANDKSIVSAGNQDIQSAKEETSDNIFNVASSISEVNFGIDYLEEENNNTLDKAKLKTIYTVQNDKKSGEKTTTVKTYDKDKNLISTQIITTDKDGNAKSDSTYNSDGELIDNITYEYDKNGNIKSTSTYTLSIDESTSEKTIEESVFDADGIPISSHFIVMNQDETLQYESKYSYNFDDNITNDEQYWYDENGELESIAKSRTHRDDTSGEITETTEYFDSNAELESTIESKTYTDDASGEITETKKINYYEGEVESTTKSKKYTDHASGEITETIEDFNSEGELESTTKNKTSTDNVTYETVTKSENYNANGDLTRTDITSKDETGKITSTLTYDPDGNLTNSLSYEYYENNKIQKRTSVHQSELGDKTTETINYDTNNNQTSKQEIIADKNGNTKSDLTYDSDDNLIEGVIFEYSKDGNPTYTKTFKQINQ